MFFIVKLMLLDITYMFIRDKLFYRGPHGIKQSEPGQDRNVAALRMMFMP